MRYSYTSDEVRTGGKHWTDVDYECLLVSSIIKWFYFPYSFDVALCKSWLIGKDEERDRMETK